MIHRFFYWVFSIVGLGFAGVSYSVTLGEPLPKFEGDTWNYIEVPESFCRDGSTAGFYLNYNDRSKNLMIYLEGGGACFNSQTCNLNPSKVIREAPSSVGVFDRDNPENPLKDWNVVYVPYCTGDVYAGTNESADVTRHIKDQKFVGYRNITRFLERIVPTFSNADKVLLTGISAGGFGSVFNYDQVQTHFGDTPVYMIDDSGIGFSDDYLAPCLQNRWRQLWGIDGALPEDCTDCRNEQGGGLVNISRYIADKYPDRTFAYLSHMSDSTIRLFYGFGRNNCNVLIPSTPARVFRAGILQARDEILTGNSVFFLTEGTDHTFMGGGRFFSKSAENISLTQWVGSYLSDEATSRGPSENLLIAEEENSLVN